MSTKTIKFIIAFFFLFFYFNPQTGWAEEGIIRSPWNGYVLYMEGLEKKEQYDGQAYMITGGLLLLGSTISYMNTQNITQRLVFGTVQILSTMAIGYGAYLYTVGSADRSYYHVLQDVRLTNEQKDQFATSYLNEKKYREDQLRTIKKMSFLVFGVTQLLIGTQEKNPESQKVYYALGGANLLVSLSF